MNVGLTCIKFETWNLAQRKSATSSVSFCVFIYRRIKRKTFDFVQKYWNSRLFIYLLNFSFEKLSLFVFEVNEVKVYRFCFGKFNENNILMYTVDKMAIYTPHD